VKTERVPVSTGHVKALPVVAPNDGTIALGDDTVADVQVGNGGVLMLRGIKVGVTNLVALGEDRKPLYQVDVHVTPPAMVRVISGNAV
jgi:Flp pilus assembly secretin CpaC